MHVWRIVAALVLTPVVAIGSVLAVGLFLGLMEEFGEDIFGIGFLLGWLTLIFSIIYKLLS